MSTARDLGGVKEFLEAFPLDLFGFRPPTRREIQWTRKRRWLAVRHLFLNGPEMDVHRLNGNAGARTCEVFWLCPNTEGFTIFHTA